VVVVVVVLTVVIPLRVVVFVGLVVDIKGLINLMFKLNLTEPLLAKSTHHDVFVDQLNELIITVAICCAAQ
jgi:hypothetical protein